VAAVGLAVRVLMEPFGGWTDQWQQVIIAISLASMFLGAFAAIGQTNIKRLMAYSGINNIGFALMGLAAGNVQGVNGVLVYLTLYLIMVLGTFGCILLMRRDGRYVETSPTCPACRAAARCWPWPSRSSCSRSPASRRWPGSSASSTSSAPPSTPASSSSPPWACSRAWSAPTTTCASSR
jgi:hypothetical protein